MEFKKLQKAKQALLLNARSEKLRETIAVFVDGAERQNLMFFLQIVVVYPAVTLNQVIWQTCYNVIYFIKGIAKAKSKFNYLPSPLLKYKSIQVKRNNGYNSN
jgi:hypothetical protein